MLRRQSSLINFHYGKISPDSYDHPTTGTGKPEALRGDRKGQWSRRITGEHRLIYEIHEDIITVVMISAAGHYGDK